MTLTQVYDGDKLVGLADATQTPSDPPLTKLEKETLRLWREHQQQAEQIEQLHGVCSRYEAENQRLKEFIKEQAENYGFTHLLKENKDDTDTSI